MIRPALAVLLFAAYFGGWQLGALEFDRADVPSWPRELFYGLSIGLPSFLVGALFGR